MAQGQIVQARRGDVAGADGVIAALGGHLPVEKADVEPAVLRRPEPGEEALLLPGRGKGGAVEHHVPQLQGGHPPVVEDVHIVRPLPLVPEGAPAVVVAGSDEDLGPHAPQGGGQGLHGLLVYVFSVKQVAGQEHQPHALFIDIVRQALRHLAQLFAPLGRLPGLQGPESAVQMPVGGVDKFDHRSVPLLRSRTWAARCLTLPLLSSPCTHPPRR